MQKLFHIVLFGLGKNVLLGVLPKTIDLRRRESPTTKIGLLECHGAFPPLWFYLLEYSGAQIHTSDEIGSLELKRQ